MRQLKTISKIKTILVILVYLSNLSLSPGLPTSDYTQVENGWEIKSRNIPRRCFSIMALR